MSFTSKLLAAALSEDSSDSMQTVYTLAEQHDERQTIRHNIAAASVILFIFGVSLATCVKGKLFERKMKPSKRKPPTPNSSQTYTPSPASTQGKPRQQVASPLSLSTSNVPKKKVTINDTVNINTSEDEDEESGLLHQKGTNSVQSTPKLNYKTSLTSSYGEGGDSSLDAHKITLQFAFINFWVPLGSFNSCRTNKKEKQILNNISCRFQPGTLTAIMGPSGCGKSTAVNLLCGRLSSGRFSGLRMINGRPYPAQDYTNFMKSQGYVQQTDTFFEDLTVRETMNYAAMLRMPADTPIEAKIQRISDVLKEVKLDKFTETVVGGMGVGLSGGQRRRLSIAIELLSVPSVLVLDEPTSGLDATTSLNLVQTLKALAIGGQRTVITTIHQPRSEIIEMFDTILLLGEGGCPIFFGPSTEASTWLKTVLIGRLDFSLYSNPGDFIIDALGLDSEVAESYSNFNEVNQHKMTGAHTRSLNLKYLESELYNNAMRQIARDLDEKGPDLSINVGYPTSFFTQIWLLFARRMKRVMSAQTTVVQLIIMFIVMLTIGIAYSYPASAYVTPYQNLLFLMLLCSYGMIVQYLELVPERFAERPILRKEREAGVTRLDAYVFSSLLTDVPRGVIHGVLLTSVGYITVELNKNPTYIIFCYICLIVGICAWQSIVTIACSVTDNIGRVYSFLFLVLGLGTLFGGLAVTFPHIPPYFKWAYYSSVPGTATRALVMNDLQFSTFTSTCKDLVYYTLDNAQITLNHTGIDLSVDIICSQTSPSFNTTGNLGRAMLYIVEFEGPDKYECLYFLMLVILCARVLEFLIYHFFEWISKRLTEEPIEPDVMKLKMLKSLITPATPIKHRGFL